MRPVEEAWRARDVLACAWAISPAWRGPQRFILQIEGEQVVGLEYRDGYNERGAAERLTKLDLPQSLQLVTRLCGTCSFAHTLAFCQAIEALCELPVGERAALLRTAAAEFERAGSHLLAAASILASLGLTERTRLLRDLREMTLALMTRLSGARLMPDFCLPGGVRRNLSPTDREELLIALPKIHRQLYQLTDSLIDQRLLLARTVDMVCYRKLLASSMAFVGRWPVPRGLPVIAAPITHTLGTHCYRSA